MNNLDDKTVAWILLALAGASKDSPATRREISLVADGINHAVPTDQELNGSIRILQAMQFLQVSGKVFSLTHAGAAFVVSATQDQTTMLGSWHSLATSLSNARRNWP